MGRERRQLTAADWDLVGQWQDSLILGWKVAADLGITERTVETHLQNMYIRYDVANRTELLNLARRSGSI